MNPLDVKQLKKEAAKLRTPHNKRTLKPILSPLEQAVINHSFQPFLFRFNREFVYVSLSACKRLLQTIMLKVQLVTDLAEKERLSIHIPHKLRETFDDPAIVLSLDPVLRNGLCRIELYTLFAIMKKGRKYLIKQKFSETNIQKLEAIFTKYKCKHLFK